MVDVLEELAKDTDFEEVFIDSTVIRVHQHGAGAAKKDAQAIGRSHAGLSTKIHALVDALGNLTRWTPTAAQPHDVVQTEPLLAAIHPEKVAADKAYASRKLIDAIHDVVPRP